MILNAAEYGRLPGVGRAIVDLDRRIDDGLTPKVIALSEARRVRALIVERDDLVRSADRTYGCKIGGDGTARS